MLLSALRQSMRQSLLCCSVPQLHCPLMSVELSDVFTGALLVHFEESVSPHSVCFLGNHCSADPFFRRGATDVCLWREKSARQCVHMVRGALSRAPRRGIREPAALAPPRVRTFQARRKPGTHNGTQRLLGPHRP